MDIFSLLAIARTKNASDLLLSADNLPLIRVNSALEKLDNVGRLSANDLNDALRQLVSPEETEYFRREHELDFGYSLPDGTRLRGNAAVETGATSLAIRILPTKVPTIDELELPQILKELILLPRGLVVVSGPTGSGKTTTQAAMIQHLNTFSTRHVVTIEDPIEYLHPNINSIITQRELGSDTFSFSQALKHVLRQNPDVILVGEMRDSETADGVLSLAETGHLILTTSHASNASQTIERIIDLFPHQERYSAQLRLANLLTAVVCQTLVPRAERSGRIAAVEVMMIDSGIRHLIHEGNFSQISGAVRMVRRRGVVTFDESLVKLYLDGVITMGTVLSYCNDKEDVGRLISVAGERRAFDFSKSLDLIPVSGLRR